MELNTAKQITQFVCGPNRYLVKAISLFRGETGLGLIASKTYLEQYGPGDEDALMKHLCTDFVQNKKDVLIQLVAEQRQLATRIEQLVCEISAEEQEESQIEEVPQGLVIKATANFEVTSPEESNEHV